MKFRKIVLIYLVILICLLISALLSYRYFVEIPRFESALSLLHDRELETLKHAVTEEVTRDQAVNYDYAVWDSNYEFMLAPNEQFIKENFGDPGFITLAYDGVFYLNPALKQVYAKTFDHVSGKNYSLDLFNFAKYPENKVVFPTKEYLGVPNITGILSSEIGPLVFSSTQIRHSDRSGDNIGILVFIHKLRKETFAKMSASLNMNVEVTILDNSARYNDIKNDIKALGLPASEGAFSYVHQRLIRDINNKPVILLTISHPKVITMHLIDWNFIVVLLLLVLFSLFGVFVTNKFLVGRLEGVITLMKEMAISNKLKPVDIRFNIYELDKAAQRFNGLVDIVNKQKQLLEDLSLLDQLTKIANRRAFEGHIENQWLLMQRNRSPLAVVMCDVDYFKRYNDFFGHQKGDETLAQIAQALQNCMHRPDDLVARYGGEEFVIVISNTDIEGLRHNLEKIVHCIRRLEIPHPDSKTEAFVTITVGASLYNDFEKIPIKVSYKDILFQADRALYAAKAAGRNRAVLFKKNDNQDQAVG